MTTLTSGDEAGPGRRRIVVGRTLVLRAGWVVAEQVVNSLGNALLSVLVARSSDARGFGAFALTFAVFALLVGVSGAVGAQPYQVTCAALDPPAARHRAGEATGTVLLMSSVAGLVIAAAATVLTGPTRTAMFTLAVLLPLVLLQDTWRAILKAQGRPGAAFWSTSAMVAVQVGLLLISHQVHRGGAVIGLAAWGIGSGAGLLIAVRIGGAWPHLQGVRRWWHDVRGLAAYYLGDNLLSLGSQQLAVLLMALIASSRTVGALRGVQVLLGPINIVGFSAFSFGVPEVARRTWLSPTKLRLSAAMISLGLAATSAAYGGILLSLPDRVGRDLLGATWATSRHVLLPASLGVVVVALKTGCVTVLRARLQARTMFGLNCVQAVLTVIGAVIGVHAAGARGAAWGLTGVEIVMLPLWIAGVGRGTRAEARPQARGPRT